MHLSTYLVGPSAMNIDLDIRIRHLNRVKEKGKKKNIYIYIYIWRSTFVDAQCTTASRQHKVHIKIKNGGRLSQRTRQKSMASKLLLTHQWICIRVVNA